MTLNVTMSAVCIGVLAIQGAFIEHIHVLRRITGANGLIIKEVRKPEDMEYVQGLIIPGGESTTMSLVSERNGLLPVLKSFVQSGKPLWGTCAGLIWISKGIEESRNSKQSLQRVIHAEKHSLAALDVIVERNFFGSQLASFQGEIDVPVLNQVDPKRETTFQAVFIRAPIIAKVLDDTKVETLASVDVPQSDEKAIVAVRQGYTLGTAFHPELTQDDRFHRLFLNMLTEYVEKNGVL